MRQYKLVALLCYHTSLSALRDGGALYPNGHPMTHSLFILGHSLPLLCLINDVVEDILAGKALQTSRYYFLRVIFKWNFRIERKSLCGHCQIALQEGHSSLFSQQLAAKTLIKLLA